jgi:hypothetical protein
MEEEELPLLDQMNKRFQRELRELNKNPENTTAIKEKQKEFDEFLDVYKFMSRGDDDPNSRTRHYLDDLPPIKLEEKDYKKAPLSYS